MIGKSFIDGRSSRRRSVWRGSLDVLDEDEFARSLALFEMQSQFFECVKDVWRFRETQVHAHLGSRDSTL
jgi:hypothetical protein